jgi:hypothetical protein
METWHEFLAGNDLLANYRALLQAPMAGRGTPTPADGIRTYNPFRMDLFPVYLEITENVVLEWRTWLVGSHHPLRVQAPCCCVRGQIHCYLVEGSVHALLQAWNLCLLDSATRWACPWCIMAPMDRHEHTMAQMATHLWTAHPGQLESALWTLAPPVRCPITDPESRPPPSPWSADYLENRALPAQIPPIYHHAMPEQD